MAGSNIRGITVEISGDTKKLNNALADTAKEIKSTENELKQVEKLLKLNPQSTELLTQKQTLLAKSIAATREKLSALQQAEARMGEANQNNSAWEEAYEPLRVKIEAVTESMKKLTAQESKAREARSAGTIRTDEYDKLKKALDETTEESKRLAKAKKDLEAQFSSGHLSDEEYRKFRRSIIETEQELEKLENEAGNSGSALKNFSESATGIGEKLGGAAEKLKGLSLAVGGVATAAVAVVKGTEELRTDLSKLDNNARESGAGVDAARQAFEKFNIVSDETDSAVEATSNLLQAGFAESNLQKAVEGLAGAYLRFPDTLKIESLADSLQETLATGTATGQFGELLDRLGIGAENFSNSLSQCYTEEMKQQMALNVLAQGGLSETYNAWLQNNEALVESKQANADVQMSMAELGNALQPLVSEGMQMFAEIIKDVSRFLSGLDDNTKKFILTIGLGAMALAPFLSVISSIFNVVGGISNGIGGLGEIGKLFSKEAGNSVYLTFLKWSLIIGAVVALVTALVVAISVLIGKGDQMSSVMRSTSGVAGGGGNIPRYASGTDYHPGGLALVGEELLSLPRGSRVYTNKETRTLIGGGGPAAESGGTDRTGDLISVVLSGVSQIVRAIESKDVNTYLDRRKVTGDVTKQQQYQNKMRGTSMTKG